MVTRMSLRVAGSMVVLFEVLGVHLAEALEAGDVDLAFSAEAFGEPFGLFGLVEAIDAPRSLGQAEEGRAGKVEVAVVDQRPHLGEEEGHQERGDMRAVDVGVGHDDDLVVAQVVDVEARPEADAERLGEVGDLLVAAELGRGGAEDVEDLAAQRQQRLGLAGRAPSWPSRRPSRPRR